MRWAPPDSDVITASPDTISFRSAQMYWNRLWFLTDERKSKRLTASPSPLNPAISRVHLKTIWQCGGITSSSDVCPSVAFLCQENFFVYLLIFHFFHFLVECSVECFEMLHNRKAHLLVSHSSTLSFSQLPSSVFTHSSPLERQSFEMNGIFSWAQVFFKMTRKSIEKFVRSNEKIASKLRLKLNCASLSKSSGNFHSLQLLNLFSYFYPILLLFFFFRVFSETFTLLTIAQISCFPYFQLVSALFVWTLTCERLRWCFEIKSLKILRMVHWVRFKFDEWKIFSSLRLNFDSLCWKKIDFERGKTAKQKSYEKIRHRW